MEIKYPAGGNPTLRLEERDLRMIHYGAEIFVPIDFGSEREVISLYQDRESTHINRGKYSFNLRDSDLAQLSREMFKQLHIGTERAVNLIFHRSN